MGKKVATKKKAPAPAPAPTKSAKKNKSKPINKKTQVTTKTKAKQPTKAKAKAPPKKIVPAPPKKAVKVPPPKKAKVPKKPSGPLGYTETEYQTFKDFKEKYHDYGNQALKDLLRKNMQSMSGNKDELIYKCADGATLGQIPRCPKCFGGRPKWDHLKGTYHCSGYRDDTDFHNCHTNFKKEELTRTPWIH